MNNTIDIGSRLELFIDRLLVESLGGTSFKLHEPHLEAPPVSGIAGHYMTVLQDGDRYRAYYRQYDPSYTGDESDGNEGEITCFAESADGKEWQKPDLGLFKVGDSLHNNTVLRMAPYSHNFAPFLDNRPGCATRARYKALAGTRSHDGKPDGLHAFQSADGLHWEFMSDGPVLCHAGFAFDSQNVAFWSEAESCYVCYFRAWETTHGELRSVSRATSDDFLHWSEGVAMNPNLPGEHLYTSQTHPYFRAPHIYIALPTRFLPDRGESTDILFMATRAGTEHYERLFTEALIRPGLDTERWGNRSNYAALGVVPTGRAEMSIYHGPAGRRYSLRTDGFVSVHAGAAGGRMTTSPILFKGTALTLNLATAAAGGVRVELQNEHGQPLSGRALADCAPIFTDAIEHIVTWQDGSDVARWQGTPVRLCIEMREADLYSLRFTSR